MIDIGEVGIESAELLSEIHFSVFENLAEQAWSKKEFQDLFSIKGTQAYVICLKSNPIGFALLREVAKEVEIITFCILPNWGNNGYATLLLEWIINKLQLQSFKQLFLEVRENNVVAIKLYEKCDFKQVGRRKGYYDNHQGGKLDALVMQCDLIV